jgi:hypothetical protein
MGGQASPVAVELGRRGGKARAKQLRKMTAQQRQDLARKAAQARWAKVKKDGTKNG